MTHLVTSCCAQTVTLTYLLLAICWFPLAVGGKDRAFDQDVDVEEEGSGERLQLHSHGLLALSVDLDTLPQVKRVACAENRLLVALTDSTVAHGWRPGQVVVGSPKWGCNSSRDNPLGEAIYVKIQHLEFPLEHRSDISPVDIVTVYHVPAGPFDMLEEADIFFRYEPPDRKSGDIHDHDDARRRFRRSVRYNLVTNLADNVNFSDNFYTLLPYDLGQDNVTTGQNAAQMALHKSWGEKGLNATRGHNSSSLTDDFVLFLQNIQGEHRMSYTFDLVIKNVKGTPHIVRYISQFDIESDLSMDATVAFGRELGVSYNLSLSASPEQELLRVPVATTLELPPVFLVLSYQSLAAASVRAYAAGATVLTTGFQADGFTTVSQQFDPKTNTGSDATSRGWSVQPRTQSLANNLLTRVDFSVFQQFKLNAAILWSHHDVGMQLAPPTELTVRPSVRLRSRNLGLAHCVHSSLSLHAHAHTARSHLTLDAFGKRVWDVPLQPSMTRDLHLTAATLGKDCHAQCSGPSDVTPDSAFLATPTAPPVVRGDQQFQSFRVMTGDVAAFEDAGQSATWCGSPGMPCYSCSGHAHDTPSARACSTRLMTSRMVSALSHLAELISVEWPDKKLLVKEAWDEPTSINPSGLHPDTSLYKHGRAATVALTSLPTPPGSSPGPLPVDSQTLARAGQLAVCAGLDAVTPDTGRGQLHVQVAEDGAHQARKQLGGNEAAKRAHFWHVLQTMDVSADFPKCAASPYMAAGSRWPDQAGNPEDVCGPSDQVLYRADRQHMDRLVHFNFIDSSLTFDPEGNPDRWCGLPTRPCIDCTSPSTSQESWDWCSTRMMSPRLALRLRRLQKFCELAGLDIRVLFAFMERSQDNTTSASYIFGEGRAARLVTRPAGNESTLASLAVCAGFDYVSHASPGHVDVYVKTQDGYYAHDVVFQEGSEHLSASDSRHGNREYEIPEELAEETDFPLLVDGGYRPEAALFQHLTVGDVVSSETRYFRMDPLLLMCVELIIDDFQGTLEIVPDSAYRKRSDNFLHNLDTRPEEEQWRHQTGQALQLRPLSGSSDELMLALATSVLRECPAEARRELRAVGLGCHDDHIYLDIRPLEQGREADFVQVWDAGTTYCGHVIKMQLEMIAGGPVLQSQRDVTCQDRGLDKDLYYLSFQMGLPDLCQVKDQAQFCQLSRPARRAAAERLQELLTNSAGHGRLPRTEIRNDTWECLVGACGGCSGSGPMFDRKVRACARVVRIFVEKAAAAYPDLTDTVTFFNTDKAESRVHGDACRTGRVCVEETVIHSLLVSTVTGRFYPDEKSTVEREMFAGYINPTPLLDIAAQDLAIRAQGKVTVYMENEGDTYALRKVLKVLFAYNKNVTLVEIVVTSEEALPLVTSSIQRKVTVWAAVVCPDVGRFAMTPYVITVMDPARSKRSAELSEARNKMKHGLYNWERDWLDKMF